MSLFINARDYDAWRLRSPEDSMDDSATEMDDPDSDIPDELPEMTEEEMDEWFDRAIRGEV